MIFFVVCCGGWWWGVSMFLVFFSDEKFGLFHQDPTDPSKSQWCEDERGLDFYGFKSGTELIYRDKHRYLRVKMLDGAVKTVLVCMRH